LVSESNDVKVYRDFAHSPSKLKATLDAVREQFPERCLIAAFELHTFSSLSGSFLPEYVGAMNLADIAIVYFNAHVFEAKQMEMLEIDELTQTFGDHAIITNEKSILIELIEEAKNDCLDNGKKAVILMMSSGNFDGLDLATL
ncbi:MAG: peptidoglycan synthetase, partial [Bacteroidia bacterium]|nr:peptidoglycan synthetase [Bacteroidia bacterium]